MFARSEMVFVAAALLVGGCNDTAVLEGEIVFPPEQGTPWVNVQVQRAEVPFSDEWGGGTNLSPHRLESGATTYRFSLETQEPDTDVHLRLRLCREPDCSTAIGDGSPDPQAEVRVVLEQPFYVQTSDPRPTRWRATFDALPACVECDVDGDGVCPSGFTCREGSCFDAEGVCLATEPALAIPQTSCRRVASEVVDPTWECTVDDCGIAGCFDGEAPGGYCNFDGVHFCVE